MLIAAGDSGADWARNLDADPRCQVTFGDVTWAAAMAAPVDDATAAKAVRELILKYGTPAERLGRGPVYRVRASTEAESG